MRRFPRTFLFERLESRLPLAGNISATMVGNELHIEGDDLGNTLTIEQGSSGGIVLTAGIDDAQVRTTINGNDSTVTFDDVPHLISVTLNGGNDRLFITSGGFEALHVDLGSGDDFTHVGSLGSIVVRNDLLVHLGDGHDFFNQTSTNAALQRLEAGDGNDTVTISNSYVTSGLILDGSAGFDAIRIERSYTIGFSGVFGGVEADRIEVIHSFFVRGISILAGAGGDLVDVVGCGTTTTLFVALETDFGVMTVRGARVLSAAYLTADGHSHVNIEDSIASRLEIATASSSDVVRISGSILEELFVLLGSGNDELRITTTQLGRGGRLNAEEGTDSIFLRDNAFVGLGGMSFEMADIA